MPRIKKGEKAAMLAIIEYGFSFLVDDMGGNWDDNDFNVELGFAMKELEDAFKRLKKKGGFE